jgi:excisionase family DNA binding protein
MLPKLLSPEAEAELLALIDERVALRVASLSLQPPESPWLTVDEAAGYLRTSPAALYKRISRGQLNSYRPEGSRILLRKDDLDRAWTLGADGPMMSRTRPREAVTSGALTPGGQS